MDWYLVDWELWWEEKKADSGTNEVKADSLFYAKILTRDLIQLKNKKAQVKILEAIKV